MQSNPQIQAGTIVLTEYPIYIPVIATRQTICLVLGNGLWAELMCNIFETEH